MAITPIEADYPNELFARDVFLTPYNILPNTELSIGFGGDPGVISLQEVGEWSGNVINVTSDPYSATADDVIILVDITSGGDVYLQPASSVANKVITIKRINASGTITINAYGSETIDNASSYNLDSRYKSISIVSDGSDYWII